jgi:OmcA/MtrC family decaheme c-type cytochrome
VSITFIAATIPAGQRQYTSYTTRVQGTATQASGENNGTWTTLAEGDYEYTFRTKAPSAFDKTSTHSIGVYGSRNLSEFDLGTNYDDDVFNFVPDGSAVTVVRDVIRTESCNRCHDPLALHGGSRRTMELCNLCHSPQTIDPDTGNTVDMPVMIHKIHMGASLPSVQAGKPYIIVGNQGSVHDYSNIHLPSDARRCFVCHEQEGPTAGSQKERVFAANRAACGACHDNVNFATGENHVGLPQFSDNQCTTCHIPQGEIEFDASIKGAHTVPTESSMLPGTVFGITAVNDGLAGKKPTVTFTIKDKQGNPILPSEMARVALVMAGPDADYAAYVSEDAVKATGANGTYTWTFANAIPANAKGTYSIGIEGYRNQTLLPGTEKQQVVRDAGHNVVFHFSVDGSKVEPRRQVVTLEKCNACHEALSLHGGNRDRIEQCVLCHAPNVTDVAVRPAAQMPAQSIDMRLMIHKIHTGEELSREYTVFGRGSTPYDFTEVLYPGDRRNCSACHVNNSYQLPLREGLLPVTDPRGLITKPGPETAACTSCHDGRSAASHAAANTTEIGESCATCHGTNSEFSVDRAHAR